MKVCSLYGAGFYYIPGTDICMKIGGYVRWQESWGQGNSISGGPFQAASATNPAGYAANRTGTYDAAQRVRTIVTHDTRQQTAYGTLRTYVLIGFTQDSVSAGLTIYATRAFIQIAGFTFGKATSFFDFVSTAAVAYNAGPLNTPDTGDAGQMVAAYTAQLGNGVSATIAVEDGRRIGVTQVQDTAGAGIATAFANGTPGTAATTNLGGGVNPQDIVANIRIDQAWGSAQLAAAAHEVGMTYYTSAGGAIEPNGHAEDKLGWAASVGLRLNAPMIGPGDYFQGAVHYAEGAARYTVGANTAGGLGYFSGNTVGFGAVNDAVVGGLGNGSLQLTTTWSVMASYEHFWTPSLRTSIYGSYNDVSYNATAKTLICAAGGQFVAGCDPNWSSYVIGSRSQWNVTKDFYVGLDLTYLFLNSAQRNAAGTYALAAASNGKPAGTYTVSDQSALMITWRAHRDIVP